MSAILFKGGREHMELVKNTIVPGMQKFLFGEGEANETKAMRAYWLQIESSNIRLWQWIY